MPGSRSRAGVHGPNEHFSLDHFRRGIETLIRFYWGLAEPSAYQESRRNEA